MRFLKSFLGLIVGVVLLHLFYYLIRIPLIPFLSVYATMYVSMIGEYRSKNAFSIVAIILVGLLGVFFYTSSGIASIKYYPQYGNWLAIIFDFLTAIQIAVASYICSVNSWK